MMDKNAAVSLSQGRAQSSLIQDRFPAFLRRQWTVGGGGKQADTAKSRYVGVWRLNPLGLLLTQSNSERRIPGIAAANQQSTQSREVVTMEEREKIHFPSIFTYLVLYHNALVAAAADGGFVAVFKSQMQITADASACVCVCACLSSLIAVWVMMGDIKVATGLCITDKEAGKRWRSLSVETNYSRATENTEMWFDSSEAKRNPTQ